MVNAFNRLHLQDFLTFYFEDWPSIEAAQHKMLGMEDNIEDDDFDVEYDTE